MAIVFRAVTSSTGLTPALPAGTTTDDIVLAVYSGENTAATVTAPSADWTAINTDTDAGPASALQHRTWWARKTAAALSTTWTATASEGRVCLITYSGCKTTGSPINTSSYNEGTDGSVEHTSITPSVADCMIVGLMNVFNWASSTSTDFANERLDQAEAISIYDDGLLASGSTGTLVVTTAGGGGAWGATLVALEPVAATNSGAVTIGAPSLAATGSVAEPPGPTLVGAGTAAFTATSGATLSPGLPTGWAADDIHVLIAHRSDNTAMTALTGWTQLSAANNTAAQRVEVWWRRAVGGDTAPTVTFGTGTVVRGARIVGIRGCPTSGDPFSTTLTRSDNAASATVTFATITPPDANTRLLALYAYEDDPTAASQISGWDPFVIATSTLGNDMAIGYATRTWPSASTATGALTSTVSGGTFANSPNVGVLLSLKPLDTTVTSTASVTIAKPSLAATGSVVNPEITGTGAVTIARPALAASGAFATTGTAAVAIGAPSLAATGTMATTGTVAVGIGAPSLAVSGTFATTGTATVGIGAPSLAVTGAFTPAPVTGTATVSIGVPALAATGVMATTGTAAVSIAAPALSATGEALAPGVSGTAAVNIAAPSLAASGTFATTGSAAVQIGAPALAAIGAFVPAEITGTATIAISAPSLAATGAFATTGTAAVTISAPSLAAAGTVAAPGTGSAAVTIGPPALAATGVFATTGQVAVTIAAPSLAATGTFVPLAITGTAAVSIGRPAISATAAFATTGTASISIGPPTLAAAGTMATTGMAAVTIMVPVLAASGTFTTVGVVAVQIGAPAFAAAGVFVTVGTAAVTIGPPIITAIEFVPNVPGTVLAGYVLVGGVLVGYVLVGGVTTGSAAVGDVLTGVMV